MNPKPGNLCQYSRVDPHPKPPIPNLLEPLHHRPIHYRLPSQSTGLRQRAEYRNHFWNWDFVSDQTEDESPLRYLTLIDEYTRQCLAIHVAWSIRAVDVITVVEAAMERYGKPEHIRSDNGPEFIAYAIGDWVKEKEIKTIYIKPGSPARMAISRASTTKCGMNI